MDLPGRPNALGSRCYSRIGEKLLELEQGKGGKRALEDSSEPASKQPRGSYSDAAAGGRAVGSASADVSAGASRWLDASADNLRREIARRRQRQLQQCQRQRHAAAVRGVGYEQQHLTRESQRK